MCLPGTGCSRCGWDCGPAGAAHPPTGSCASACGGEQSQQQSPSPPPAPPAEGADPPAEEHHRCGHRALCFACLLTLLCDHFTASSTASSHVSLFCVCVQASALRLHSPSRLSPLRSDLFVARGPSCPATAPSTAPSLPLSPRALWPSL